MADRPTSSASPETQRFWEAAKSGEYLLMRCRACGRKHHYPRPICPHCFSSETEWTVSSGKGMIYSCCTTSRDDVLHTIAYVTLDDGPTVLTNIVDTDPDRITVGARVELQFQSAADGRALPVFRVV